MSLLGLISAGLVPPARGCMSMGCWHTHRGRSELGQDRDALQLAGTRRPWSLQPLAWTAPRLQHHRQCHLTFTPLSACSRVPGYPPVLCHGDPPDLMVGTPGPTATPAPREASLTDSHSLGFGFTRDRLGLAPRGSV